MFFNKSKKLINAIKDNNSEKARSLINSINDINGPFEYESHSHWTFLILACRYASFEVVEMLVTAGADVNEPDECNQTTLYWASVRDDHNDSVEIADLLLNNGLDVNVQADKRDGRTALIGAILKGNNGLVDCFIKAGSDPNITMDNGGSAFYFTAQYPDEEVACKMAKSLIGAEADINHQNSADGATAINIAIEDGKLDFVKLMVESSYDLTIKNSDGYSALDYAANQEQQEIAKYLHEQGCEYDPELTDLEITGLTIGTDSIEGDMNSYLLHVSMSEKEWNHILESLEKGKEPSDESIFGQVKSAFKQFDWEGGFNSSNVEFRAGDEDYSGLWICFDSPDIFEDDIDHKRASKLYMNFCEFVKSYLFKMSKYNCEVYDKKTGIEWDWYNYDGNFDWEKDEVGHDSVEGRFEIFKNFHKMDY